MSLAKQTEHNEPAYNYTFLTTIRSVIFAGIKSSIYDLCISHLVWPHQPWFSVEL